MKKYILLMTIAAGMTLISSCADKLDIAPPNSITDEQIQEILNSGDETRIALVLGSMANAMPKYFNYDGILGLNGSDARGGQSQGVFYMHGLTVNDMVYGYDAGNGNFGYEYYSHKEDLRSAKCGLAYPYWTYPAAIITGANKMLNFLSSETVAKSSSKSLKDYRARGLVMRAFAYMSLMEDFQDAYLQGGKSKLGAILYDTYDPSQPNKARATSEETYTFIKKDLNEAVSLLQAAGIGFTADQTDIDMAVALFFRARAALWTGDYSTCISDCQSIMTNYPNLIKEANYGGKNTGKDWTGENVEILPLTNAFMNNSQNPEIIFGYTLGNTPITNAAYLSIQNQWENPYGLGFGGYRLGYARIDDRLYNQINANDFRKDAFSKEALGDYTYPNNKGTATIPSYTNLKFAATHGLASETANDTKANVNRCDWFMMRSSEVLLMLAEAQLASGSEAAAKTTLNKLLAARTRAGATTLTCDNYISGLSTEKLIQLQWRIELWGEQGSREYYNDKRWNIPGNRTGSTVHVSMDPWPVANMTLEIPEEEMINNSLCVQN